MAKFARKGDRVSVDVSDFAPKGVLTNIRFEGTILDVGDGVVTVQFDMEPIKGMGIVATVPLSKVAPAE